MYTIYADDALLYLPGDEELSVLSPVLETSCNAAGTLTFVLLPSHPLYDKLQKLKTRIRVMQDDEIIWRGRVLETESDFYRQKTVTCEGELTYLVDSVQQPYKHDGTAADLFRLYLNAHNDVVEDFQQFQIGSIDIETLSSVENTGYGNTWDEISGNLLDIHGGFLRVRYDGETRYLDWTKESGEACSQTIEFGKNLLDLTEYISAAEVVTCMIPTTSENNISINNINGGKNYIEDEEAIRRYGRIWGVTEFDAKSAEDLLKMAKEHLQKQLQEALTITISAVDLHLLDVAADAFRVGDKVRVISKPHHLDAEYTCTEISLDLVNPDKSQYTFGTPETGMASTTAATSKAVEVVDTSVEYLRQIVSDQNTHLLLFDGVIDAYTTKVDDNTKAINTVQLTLNSVTGELTSKVSKDDLVSTINQTAGAVKISANCIDLSGYVTASQFETVSGWADDFQGTTMSCTTLSASVVNSFNGDFENLAIGQAVVTDLTTGSLTVGKVAASWQKQTVVTGISDALRVSKTSQTITYATPEGGENTINVLTNVQVFAGGHYSTKKINYLGAGASE